MQAGCIPVLPPPPPLPPDYQALGYWGRAEPEGAAWLFPLLPWDFNILLLPS